MTNRKYGNFKFSRGNDAVTVTRINTGSASGKQVLRIPTHVFWDYVADEIRERKINSLAGMTTSELIGKCVK